MTTDYKDLDYTDKSVENVNAIVEANMGLVYHAIKAAKPVAKRNTNFDDYVHEGMMALWRAARGWDHTKGCTFSTYATASIKYTLTRASMGIMWGMSNHKIDRNMINLTTIIKGDKANSSLGEFGSHTWDPVAVEQELDEFTGVKIEEVPGWTNLSMREQQALRLIAEGLNFSEAAAEIGHRSKRGEAVRQHVKRGIQKLKDYQECLGGDACGLDLTR